MNAMAEQIEFQFRPAALPAGVPVDVVILFEKLALEVAAKGFTRYSARAIVHRLRWHEQIERGNSEFLINNNITPALARWFLAKHPELPEFFETRRSHSEDE